VASTIKIKRSGVANKTPTITDIATGELAINYKDQKLFSSNGTAVFQIGVSSGGLVSTTTKTFDALKGSDTVITGVTAAVSTNYLQVSNASATYATKAYAAANTYVKSILANTNSYIAAQATRITLVNTNLTGTNTAIRTLVSDRLQVANASTLYATKASPTTSGVLAHTGRATISTNLTVSGNTTVTGFRANNSLGSAGQVLKTNGTSVYWDAASSGGSTPQIQSQLFTSSSSWTAPTGVTKVRVIIIGGGAGGTTNGCGGGAAGGVGGLAYGVYTVTPGTSYTVTVGAGGAGGSASSTAGGTSSFGALVSATGGARAPSNSTGGAAGIGTGGTFRNYYVTNVMGFPFGGTSSYNPAASTAAVTWSITSNFCPGSNGTDTGSVGTGGVSGIVFLEWVG
jgi:hypothetical protein